MPVIFHFTYNFREGHRGHLKQVGKFMRINQILSVLLYANLWYLIQCL